MSLDNLIKQVKDVLEEAFPPCVCAANTATQTLYCRKHPWKFSIRGLQEQIGILESKIIQERKNFEVCNRRVTYLETLIKEDLKIKIERIKDEVKKDAISKRFNLDEL